MKNLSIKNNPNWVPLNFKYEHDDYVSFKSDSINTSDGMRLTTSTLQQNIADLSIDNYSNVALLNEIKVGDLFDFDLQVDEFPVKFTSSLICNAYPTLTNISAYIAIVESLSTQDTRDYYIGENPGRSSWVYSQTEDANEIYFNVTIHDNDHVSVSHVDNMDRVYLTVDGLDIVFRSTDSDEPGVDSMFNYYLNNDSGFLILYKTVNDVVYWLVPNVISGKVELKPATDVQGAPLPLTTAIKYTPYTRGYSNLKVVNNWVSYQTSDNQNNLNIDSTNTLHDVSNNYLIDSQFYNIDKSGDVFVNLTQLKNQLSPTGDTNSENPFPDQEPCKHREYNRIFFKDTNNLYLGYDTFEHEIIIPADSVTYFNTPQNMYPFERININDMNLVAKGAIGGDSPLHSDKIFKKTSGYKYNSPAGQTIDEDTGVWLCSWLKSTPTTPWSENNTFNENIFVSWRGVVYRSKYVNTGKQPDLNREYWDVEPVPAPVWVDRYYNPEKYTVLDALNVPGQYSTYRSKFDNVVDKLNASESYVFDKTSDLVFEPGGLYAYYRIGTNHITTIIDGLSESVTHQGIVPAFYQNRSEYIQEDLNDYLTFTGEQYIESTAPASISSSDYTISLDLCFDDWSSPVGCQILGNYTNEGVGIFNKIESTPYITLISDEKVTVYNTDMIEIINFDESDVVSYNRLTGNEDITLFKDVSGAVYDMKGLLVENMNTSRVMSYRNESEEVYITSLNFGAPGGIVRLYHDSTSAKNIRDMVDEWNSSNPEYQLTLTGDGSEFQYNSSGDVISGPWVPDADVILLESDLEETPAGRVVDTDIDDNYKYVLDESDNIFRFDIGDESLDRLNSVFPFEPIGVGATALTTGEIVTLEPSSNRYLQTVNDGEIQYIIDCDSYTIDMFNQPWYVKNNIIYKFTLNEQVGSNATLEGFIPVVGQSSERYIMLVANNRDNGSTGNLINIIPDGIKTLSTLVNEWNSTNITNLLSIVEGNPSMVPGVKRGDGSDFTIKLNGGVDRGATTTSVAFSAAPDTKIHGVKCNNLNEIFTVHGSKITKTLNSRQIIKTIDMSSLEPTLSSGSYNQVAVDIVNEFVDNGDFVCNLLLLIREDSTEQVRMLKFSPDLDLLTSVVLDIPLSVNLSKQKSITNFETIKQICKDTLNQNCIIFKTRFNSYFDTDKTVVKKLVVNVDQLSRGFHNFTFAFNSSNSNISLFVDGVLRVVESSDDTASGAAYKFSRTIHNPLLVGAEPFFNNITFSEHMKKQNYMFANNMKVANYRVFNSYLNFNDIRAIAKLGKTIEPIRLTLPCGKRDYLDHVTSFFKHKQPGKKSTVYDITVVNESLTGTDIQNYINNEITEKINGLSPVNSYMSRINWIT